MLMEVVCIITWRARQTGGGHFWGYFAMEMFFGRKSMRKLVFMGFGEGVDFWWLFGVSAED